MISIETYFKSYYFKHTSSEKYVFNYYFKQNFKFGNTVSCTQENKAQNIFFALKCTHDTIKDQNSCILCHMLYMNTCYVVYPNTLPTYF